MTTSTQHLAGWAVDPVRWPDIATAPGSAVRAAIARALSGAAVARLPVRVRLPGGRGLGSGSAAAPVMVLHRPDAFFARLGAGGLIGFGESYMAGEWDCADLTGLLSVFAAHVGDLVPGPLQRARRLAVRRQPPADEQTRDGARRNIERHYDLSNEFFALFLDQTMWRYTRHPNYFGDACMWWGIFGISYGSAVQLVTVVSPLLMTFILTRGTGQRLTDRRMAQTRPDYAGYAARTSGFIPLPPCPPKSVLPDGYRDRRLHPRPARPRQPSAGAGVRRRPPGRAGVRG